MNKNISNFWNHFEENYFGLHIINELEPHQRKQKLDNLDNHLKNYSKQLGYLIESGKNQSKLTITAHGNPYLFKSVELLVHHAPKLQYWKICAFIQPEKNLEKYINGTDKPFIYYGITLKISEMKFTPLQNPQAPFSLGIQVLLKNYILHSYNKNLTQAIHTLLEHLIGEKAFANDLDYIDIAQLSCSYNSEKTFDLYNLILFIENFKKNL